MNFSIRGVFEFVCANFKQNMNYTVKDGARRRFNCHVFQGFEIVSRYSFSRQKASSVYNLKWELKIIFFLRLAMVRPKITGLIA